jgi:citrate lyase subunit beta/citryl-CoA lyase
MLAKSATLPTDEVLLDLEDSVAPALKDEARANIVRAVKEHSWAGKTLAVRINPVQARCCYRDIIEVVDAVGELIDCLVVPKVEDSSDVVFVDRLLGMVEGSNGIGKRVLIEAQIETAAALRRIHEIAHASDRLDALVFGPADMSASLGVPGLTAGAPASGYPGDQWHWVLETILVAARDAGLQAIDGPSLRIGDIEGLRSSAVRAKALGYDGKWAVHPSQIEVLNEVFTPTQEEFDRAAAILEAYEHATLLERRGAVMFGKEMIDEASRKMAERLQARGLAAGLAVKKTLEQLRREEEGRA